MLVLPNEPKKLLLPVGRLWNGGKSPNPNLFGLVELQKNKKGIVIKTSFPTFSQNKNEEKFEIFFVEDGGQYLEVVLKSDGSCSLGGFDAPNQKVADFSNFVFETKTYKDEKQKIHTEIIIPNELFPSSLAAFNIFLVVENQILAYHPIPGHKPDLHQLAVFPLIKTE